MLSMYKYDMQGLETSVSFPFLNVFVIGYPLPSPAYHNSLRFV